MSAPDAATFLLGAGIAANLDRNGHGVDVDDFFRPYRGPFDEQVYPLHDWIDPRDWLTDFWVDAADFAAAVRRALDSVPPPEYDPAGGATPRFVRIVCHAARPAPIHQYLRLHLPQDPQLCFTAAPATTAGPKRPWRWPVRVMAPSYREDLLALRSSWLPELTRFVEATEPWCAPSLIVGTFAQFRAWRKVGVSASVGIVVGASEPFLQRSLNRFGLREMADMWVAAPDVGIPGWLHEVLFQLCHDFAIDEALTIAAARLSDPTLPPPVLYADSAAVRRSRILHRLSESAASHQDIRAVWAGRHMASETHDAQEAMDAMRLAEASAREARFLTGDVSHPNDDAVDRFEQGVAYVLHARISAEVGQVAADVAFPDETLPWEGEALELEVVFTELRSGGTGLVGNITLPRVGASTSAHFPFVIREGDDVFAARLTVLYRNRFVQTAILEVPAGGTPDAMTLQIEAVVRPTNSDLAELRHNDAALVLNHRGGEKLISTSLSGSVKIASPAGLDTVVKNLYDELKVAIDAPEAHNSLESDEFQSLLVQLARHGTRLKQTLFTGRLTAVITPAEYELLRKADRLSVFSAVPTTVLPLEYIYDFELSTGQDAPGRLCEHAVAGLTDPSRCLRLSDEGQDPLPCDVAGTDVVCPLGFWGFRKVIERHARSATELASANYAVAHVPTVNANVAGLSNVLAAATQIANVNPTEAWTVASSSLSTLLQTRFTEVRTWREVRDRLDYFRDGVLMLVTHVTRPGGKEVVMELGTDDHLKFLDDLEPYFGGEQSGPIVLLLGCSTGPGDVPLEEFPASAINAGAKLVLATMTLVRGRWVAPIGVAIVEELERLTAGGAEVPFGEALLAIRRKLLPTNPMVLTLIGYGDADWTVARGV